MEQGDHNTYDEQQYWQEEFNRQDTELLKWLDEFVTSETFLKLVKTKQQGNDEQQKEAFNVKTQYWDGKSYGKRSQRQIVLLEKLHRALDAQHIQNTIANQQKGINIIRQHIESCRRFFEQNQVDKHMQAENDIKRAIRFLQIRYNIYYDDNEKPSEKVVKKIKEMTNRMKYSSCAKDKNEIFIVRNLLKDIRRRKQSEKNEMEWTADLEVQGTAIQLLPRPVEKNPEEDTLKEQFEPVTELAIQTNDAEMEKSKTKNAKEKSKNLNQKNGKLTQASKRDKKTKTTERTTKKSKISEKEHKQHSQEPELVLPFVPRTNPREKLIAENLLGQLLSDLDNLFAHLKDKENYLLETSLEDEVSCPLDDGIDCDPPIVYFKNFVAGKVYRQKIALINGNTTVRKLKFDRIIWNGEFDEELLLEVEPIGIVKLYPGQNIKCLLSFRPEVLARALKGNLIFLTNDLKHRAYDRKVAVGVLCVPVCAVVNISPSVLSFEEMPIWRMHKQKECRTNYKVIKIKNAGRKKCKIVITKLMSSASIEQAWKNIISIMQLESRKSNEPTMSSINVAERSEADLFPRDLVQRCVENVFNTFKFDRNIFVVKGQSEVSLKCWFKNFEESAFLVETYLFNVYEQFPDGNLYSIGVQDVVVNAEISGHFLNLPVSFLDFEVCVYDSLYQLDFEIENPSKNSHHLQICFPSTMKNYLSTSTGTLTVPAGKSAKVFLKFSPRRGILNNNKYFDESKNLLEFPIWIRVQTHDFQDAPPLKVDVYAVITDSLGVVLSPLAPAIKNSDHQRIAEGCLVDLGECNTMETVVALIEIRNESLVTQHFAFKDLPQAVTIQPNFGFGKLHPKQRAILEVHISPSPQDVIESDELWMKICATTVKCAGKIKESIPKQQILKKLRKMEELLKDPPKEDKSVIFEMLNLQQLIREDFIEQGKQNKKTEESYENSTKSSQERVVSITRYDFIDEISGSSKCQSEKFDKGWHTNCLWLKVNVVNVSVDFSHQWINFRDTPCGSYAVTCVQLTARNVLHDYSSATYRIMGGNAQFQVEPSVGTISKGQSTRIMLVVRPEVPFRIVKERAYSLKLAVLMEAKRRHLKSLEEAQNGNNSNDLLKKKTPKKQLNENIKIKDSKNKEKKEKRESFIRKSQDMPEVEAVKVDPKEVIVGYFDYYGAEMNVWKLLEPFFIENTFVCSTSYINSERRTIDKPAELTRLMVKCRVIRPSFIHDYPLQEIDFGPVIVGTTATKWINLQNIQNAKIQLKVSRTNPFGSFSVPETNSVSIPSEYFYKFPISFTPTKENIEIEFLDVKSTQTRYPFILSGAGVAHNLSITPNFLVCRILGVKHNTYMEIPLEIKNLCTADLKISFVKVVEIEGPILNSPEMNEKELQKGEKLVSKNTKDNKSSKKKDTNRPKFSNELLPDEEYSIRELFTCKPEGFETFFKISGNFGVSDQLEIAPGNKGHCSILFGTLPPAGVAEFSKEKQKKGGKDKSDKSFESSDNKPTEKTVYYVSKYNILLGKRVFFKDLIIIGCFK